MRLTIEKKKLFHYLLVYCLIISQGSVLYNRYADYFILLIIGAASLFILNRKSQMRYSKDIAFFILLSIALGCTVVASSGGLSVFSAGNFLSRFLLVFLVYYFDKDEFVQRYVNLVLVLALISLVVFTIQYIDFNLVTKILPAYRTESTTYYGGVFASVVGWHSTRNIGLATEPGRHQVYLISALYFLLFKNNYLSYGPKMNMAARIILIITIITAQSTTGYLALIILLAGYLLAKSSDDNVTDERKLRNKTKVCILLLVFIAGVYTIYGGSDTFIYKFFINKLFNSSGQIDLTVSSGSSRVVSILTDLSIAIKHPFGMGYVPYQQIWLANKVGFTPDTSSCVGLTSSCAALGFHVVFLVLYFYLSKAWKNSTGIIEFLVLVLIFVNTSLAQPNLCFPPMMIMFFVQPRREEGAIWGN